MRHLMGSGPSILKDRSVFDFDHVPKDLPHRDEAYKALFQIHQGILEHAPQHSSIRGPVGTGKTALSRRFSADLVAHARDRGRPLTRAAVNCRQRPTPAAALLHVVRSFDKGFPDRGFSVTEMLDALRKIMTTRGVDLLLVLDEIDVLLQRGGGDLVYNLTRFNEDARGPRLSILVAGQHDALLLMDEATRSTFRRTNVIRLEPYTAEQLGTILAARAEAGIREGTIDDDVLDVIATRAAEEGDARFAIELLYKAAQVAESEGLDTVGVDQVREAMGDTLSQLPEERLGELNQQQALVLLAVARALKGGRPFATTGEVEDAYKVLCEEAGADARGHTQFWSMLKALTGMGLIVSRRSGKGQAGSTTLMTLPDAPLDVLERKLRTLHDLGPA